jgi:triosephosphate isomerase (TIM)
MARRKFLMGNWKMFKTVGEAMQFAEAIGAEQLPSGIDYAIAAPFTALYALSSKLPVDVKLGAQNVYYEPQGAFTGEISAAMLKDVGATYVIVGHSERRHVFNESDEWIRHKVHAVVKAGMTPVLCVGEDLRQRELNHTLRVCDRQTVSGLAELSSDEVAATVIAYEPVWAIGSGQTPTPEDAESVIQAIRGVVEREKGADAAAKVRILYGGSVKPDNIAGFLGQPNIDGALVGGASLEASSFVKLATGTSSVAGA